MTEALPTNYELTEDDLRIAARYAVERARVDLLAFVLLMNPNFSVGPHHRLLCDELMRLEKGEIDRLMVFVAPRSSKSLICSTYYPAWVLGRHSKWDIMAISHNKDLATKFGRSVRDMIDSREYRSIFAMTTVSKTNKAADSWTTDQGAQFLSAGADSGIAGYGGMLAIIDDPVSEQNAWSLTALNKINDWYGGGLRPRLMPNGRILIVQTRWNEKDLSGFLLAQEEVSEWADHWTVVEIPALNTPESCERLNKARAELIEMGLLEEDYPMLEVGGSYWPAPSEPDGMCWSTDKLIRTKGNMLEYMWNALYMQRPSNLEGNIFRVTDWQDWTRSTTPDCSYVLISFDTAFSEKTSADYSAYTIWGIFDADDGSKNMLLLGADKGRWDYPTLRKIAVNKYDELHPDGVLIEKRASGQSLIQDLRLAGVPVMEYQPDRDKVARAHAVMPFFHGGKIWAPLSRPWVKDIVEECRTFPKSPHDDYVDTVTQAILWVRNAAFLIPADSPWNQLEESGRVGKKRRRYY